LDGWSYDEAGLEEVDLEDVVTELMTLYAIWI
jgi:hypothetical protein